MMPNFLLDLVNDVIDLVYPRNCGACDNGVPVRNGVFCVDCLARLPETGYHSIPNNPFERHFWGRIPIQAGAALYFFVPGGKTQTLLHNIKYRRRQELAVEMGSLYGATLRCEKRFSDISHILPVPLHWRKKHHRGFNQSAAFSKGLAMSIGVPNVCDLLLRKHHTPSQTRLSRSQRISNMSGAFKLQKPERIRQAHVLLVDDVLTTGATLEACALELMKAKPATISMVTIACGRI